MEKLPKSCNKQPGWQPWNEHHHRGDGSVPLSSPMSEGEIKPTHELLPPCIHTMPILHPVAHGSFQGSTGLPCPGIVWCGVPCPSPPCPPGPFARCEPSPGRTCSASRSGSAGRCWLSPSSWRTPTEEIKAGAGLLLSPEAGSNSRDRGSESCRRLFVPRLFIACVSKYRSWMHQHTFMDISHTEPHSPTRPLPLPH